MNTSIMIDTCTVTFFLCTQLVLCTPVIRCCLIMPYASLQVLCVLPVLCDFSLSDCILSCMPCCSRTHWCTCACMNFFPSFVYLAAMLHCVFHAYRNIGTVFCAYRNICTVCSALTGTNRKLYGLSSIFLFTCCILIERVGFGLDLSSWLFSCSPKLTTMYAVV